MNILKKFVPALLAVSLLAGSAAYAADFPDMPNDWTTEALENAVENGLLSGFDDGTIKPNNNITRAQMATIIARSFGATAGADISTFTDVTETDWFYDAFSKAVQMGAFNGNDLNQLNPNNPIKFEECFKVVACVFGLTANLREEELYKPNDLDKQDLTVLDKFSDGSDVSAWAKPYVAAIISGGYWDGIDGKLTPKAYITRAQFAVLMDNLVKTYITKPGTYTDLPAGNIMIKSEDVTIDGLTTDNNIVISDGVKETETGINFTNCTVNGRLVIRGGGQNVNYSGFLKDFVIQNPNINLNASLSNLMTVTGYIHDASSWSYSIG